MSKFLKSGNTVQVFDDASLDISDKLEARNYTVKYNDMTGVYSLEGVDSFAMPKKYYGDTIRHAERILSTFEARPNNTGALFVGSKGSGKTLLAKTLCNMCFDLDMPTIIINAAWSGDGFNTFLQNIDQPCVILFDEFEKVYDKDTQKQILTLLDGVYQSKKLFLLTCNNKWMIDDHMRNRPGRLFYSIDFTGLDITFVREYCEDNLDDKTKIESVCTTAAIFQEGFNFDMLQALVEEVNRYGESPQEALDLLNIEPDGNNEATYNAEIIDMRSGNELKIAEAYQQQVSVNPLSCGSELYFDIEPENDGEYRRSMALFQEKDLTEFNAKNNQFTYVNDNHQRLVLTQVKNKDAINFKQLV